jgi:hypothetical protein
MATLEDQQLVFRFIVRFLVKHRYSPTWKEIGKGVYMSNAKIMRVTGELRGRGLIDFQDAKSRTIVVCNPDEVV